MYLDKSYIILLGNADGPRPRVTWKKSAKGKNKAYYMDRGYTKDPRKRKRTAIEFYECHMKRSKKCTARIHVKGDNIVKFVGQHICPIISGATEAKELKQQIKDRSGLDNLHKKPGEIVEELWPKDKTVVAAMGHMDSQKRIVAKRQSVWQPKYPDPPEQLGSLSKNFA